LKRGKRELLREEEVKNGGVNRGRGVGIWLGEQEKGNPWMGPEVGGKDDLITVDKGKEREDAHSET